MMLKTSDSQAYKNMTGKNTDSSHHLAPKKYSEFGCIGVLKVFVALKCWRGIQNGSIVCTSWLFIMASLATMICSRFASVCKSKINCWYTCWNQIFHPLFKRLKLRVYFAVRGPDIVGYNYILSSSISMLLGNLISRTASFLKKISKKTKILYKNILFSQKMRWF